MSQIAKPPTHLSKAAQSRWKTILGEWALGDTDLLVLESALEAFDRMRQAQRILKKAGLTTKDRFGQVKPHSCIGVERDSRAAWLRAIKQLSLVLLSERYFHV